MTRKAFYIPASQKFFDEVMEAIMDRKEMRTGERELDRGDIRDAGQDAFRDFIKKVKAEKRIFDGEIGDE